MRSFRVASNFAGISRGVPRTVTPRCFLRAYTTSGQHTHGRYGPLEYMRPGLASLLVIGAGAMCCAAQSSAPISCAEEQRAPSDNRVLTMSFVADAAARAAPSVVNISSITGGGLFMTGSAGSGFIISEDGFIVTNAHVVPSVPGSEVIVTLSDFRKFTANVHSIDPASDIAVVKMNVPGELFPVALLGSSGGLRPGDFVIAMGSPLQLQNSVSFGIVSATARHGSEIGAQQRSDYIQTDAAINVGNSGGPLLNTSAEVVGINNMKAQGVDGISFAIPIDTANQVITQLLKYKTVIRPYIGMNMVNYYPSGKSSKKLPASFRVGETLVQVAEVNPGSPAETAGLKSGDIIVGVNGKKVVNGIPDVLGCIGLEVGKSISFDIKRRSEGDKTVTVVTAADKFRRTGKRR